MYKLISLKNGILLFFLWIIEDLILNDIQLFANIIDKKTTPAIYVFLQSDQMFLLLFMLEIIWFYAEVPFTYKNQIYYIIRKGKIKWYLQHIAYLVFSSFSIIMISFAVCLIQLAGSLSFTLKWDQVLGTLALTDASIQYEIVMQVPYKIISHYSPLEALSYTLAIGWGCVLFIAVFMYIMSFLFGRKIAVILASGYILLFAVQQYYSSFLNYVSPVSWMRITEVGEKYSDLAPEIHYIATAIIIGLFILFLIGYIWIKRHDIIWMEEE